MLRKWIFGVAVLGVSLWSYAGAETEWLKDPGGRWCIAHDSKRICLSEGYEMKRVTSSAIKLTYHRDLLPPVFAIFHNRPRSPYDGDPYPDSLMKLQSARLVHGVSISEFRFSDPEMGGSNYSFILLVFDESFTLVLNGNAKDLIEVEVASLLEQWRRDAS